MVKMKRDKVAGAYEIVIKMMTDDIVIDVVTKVTNEIYNFGEIPVNFSSTAKETK